MKVLLANNKYPPDIIGGAEIVASQMAEEPARQGLAVQVLTTGPRNDKGLAVVKYLLRKS